MVAQKEYFQLAVELSTFDPICARLAVAQHAELHGGLEGALRHAAAGHRAARLALAALEREHLQPADHAQGVHGTVANLLRAVLIPCSSGDSNAPLLRNSF